MGDILTNRQGDLQTRCKITTSGDAFVGIKVEDEKPVIYFPLGYHLSSTDTGLRQDIRRLIRVLAEFFKQSKHEPQGDMAPLTTMQSLLSNEKLRTGANAVAGDVASNLPLHAYLTIIEYYLEHGYYLTEEPIYRENTRGKVDWRRTLTKNKPLLRTHEGRASFIYTSLTTKSFTSNDEHELTELNKYCVWEAFSLVGWLYTSYTPPKPSTKPNFERATRLLVASLNRTNNDKKRILFQAMLDILRHCTTCANLPLCTYGTTDFAAVWEWLIAKAFGNVSKVGYLPGSHWILTDSNQDSTPTKSLAADNSKTTKITIVANSTLEPDTIMHKQGKYYIIDAKYYRYGLTVNAAHLPQTAAIAKQITYAQNLEVKHGIAAERIYNIFLLPYNSTSNQLSTNSIMSKIGHNVASWCRKNKPYEKVLGVVLDTGYLIANYRTGSGALQANLVELVADFFPKQGLS